MHCVALISFFWFDEFLWSYHQSWNGNACRITDNFEDIEQTWPKCGPPTYFCGPWTFFCYEKKQHVDLLLPEIWSKAVNKSIKRTKKKFCCAYFELCGPWWKNSFQIWPVIKKVWPPLIQSLLFIYRVYMTSWFFNFYGYHQFVQLFCKWEKIQEFKKINSTFLASFLDKI